VEREDLRTVALRPAIEDAVPGVGAPRDLGAIGPEAAVGRELRLVARAGYHLNKRHWNTVILDGSLPDEGIRDMIEDSYDLVVSKLPRAPSSGSQLARRRLA
jgi:YjbR